MLYMPSSPLIIIGDIFVLYETHKIDKCDFLKPVNHSSKCVCLWSRHSRLTSDFKKNIEATRR